MKIFSFWDFKLFGTKADDDRNALNASWSWEYGDTTAGEFEISNLHEVSYLKE